MELKKRPGYALLFVLLTTSALTFYCLALFRSGFNSLLIPSLEVKVAQERYLTQGLLEYGIAFCSENKDKLFIEKDTAGKEIILTAGQWPSGGGTPFSGRITIKSTTQARYTVKAQLLLGKRSLYTISCDVIPLYTNKEQKEQCSGLRIAHWVSSKDK